VISGNWIDGTRQGPELLLEILTGSWTIDCIYDCIFMRFPRAIKCRRNHYNADQSRGEYQAT
jgi:hypothetical protein